MMNRDQDTFEKIEGYLNQSLSAEQRSDFERQMNTDAELRQEVERHRSLHTDLGDTDALEFRKKLVDIGKGLETKQSRNKWFSWKVAATLLVLVGMSVYLLLRPKTTQDLFEAYYSPYPVEDLVRGNEEMGYDAILEDYSNGDYVVAMRQLEQLTQNDPDNELLKLYLGNSYLNLGREEEAVRVFKGIAKQSNYHEDAQWYLALTYIKQKEFKNAAERLNWLVNYDGVHKKNASDILNKIRIENPDDF